MEPAEFQEVLEWLQRIDAAVRELAERRTVKESYSPAEVAQILNKKPYTVREWCRLGRLNATKALSGRGIDGEWRISREEILRWQKEGLLPVDRPYRHVR